MGQRDPSEERKAVTAWAQALGQVATAATAMLALIRLWMNL